MASKICKRNRKTTKTFFCDSCFLHGTGTLESHDSAVHKPTPSMYRKCKILKRIFGSKLKKVESKKSLTSDLKCNKCHLYIHFTDFLKHLNSHDRKEENKRRLDDIFEFSIFSGGQCIRISDDEEEEFQRRRYLYPRNDPRFNGLDSMLTCLKCNDILLTLSKFKSHKCPKEIREAELEETKRRRYLYPRTDPRFNNGEFSMLTCLTCNAIFDTLFEHTNHQCPAPQTSFVTLENLM